MAWIFVGEELYEDGWCPTIAFHTAPEARDWLYEKHVENERKRMVTLIPLKESLENRNPHP